VSVLSNGDTFPTLDVNIAGGGTMVLPRDLRGSFGVVLLYRGAWCPYCNAQLAAFARAAETLGRLGVRVVALSVDDEAASTRLVAERRLNFPVGYGADADAIAAATGAYTNDSPRYLQSTGFVLDPDGRVITAVYSSAAIGRLVPDDVVGFVRYVTAHA
jgi:peroxiredoxin